MIEDLSFQREAVVDVDAAVVGIGRQRWVGISDSEASVQNASAIMRHNRFDLLPILTDQGDDVTAYYHTKIWNDYGSVDRGAIDYDDVIPVNTPIRAVIRNLAQENRLFYFLSSESRIVGLISVANLNCRQVRVYLFSLISELELRLSRFVHSELSENEVFGLCTKADVIQQFEGDRESGVDASIMEYLYLSDLIAILRKKGYHSALGYDDPKTFKADFGRLLELRNEAAHPTRSLISGRNDVAKLWRKLEIIEHTLFHLRRCRVPEM